MDESYEQASRLHTTDRHVPLEMASKGNRERSAAPVRISRSALMITIGWCAAFTQPGAERTGGSASICSGVSSPVIVLIDFMLSLLRLSSSSFMASS